MSANFAEPIMIEPPPAPAGKGGGKGGKAANVEAKRARSRLGRPAEHRRACLQDLKHQPQAVEAAAPQSFCSCSPSEWEEKPTRKGHSA